MAPRKRPKAATPYTVLREQRAIELRLAGMSYADIGVELGRPTEADPDAKPVSMQRAHAIVQTGLARSLREPAERLREIELRRLERQTRALWSLAIYGRREQSEPVDNEAQARAQLRLLQIADRRAKLLGLDAPIEVTVTETREEAADRIAGELAAFQAGRRAEREFVGESVDPQTDAAP